MVPQRLLQHGDRLAETAEIPERAREVVAGRDVPLVDRERLLIPLGRLSILATLVVEIAEVDVGTKSRPTSAVISVNHGPDAGAAAREEPGSTRTLATARERTWRRQDHIVGL